MFWYFVLSHLLGDYPLQPDWIARNKTKVGFLAIHAGIHFAVMLVIVGLVNMQWWPYLLLLAALHFLIDLGKMAVNRIWPRWVILPYATDQALHYFTIWWVVILFERAHGDIASPPAPSWLIFAIGYLLVTHVWYISERVLAYKDESYRQEITAQAWARMITRALLLSLFLWGSNGFAAPLLAAGMIHRLPYLASKYALRAFLIDLIVAFSAMLFIRWLI